ncbi:MAG TPA: class I SAM-dependent methyltransferase [Candidatus Acidoferrales bacterium]|nr:class I SAM-dependent methyltransferase [Candidatus Acidoferrales bacterium]
MQEARPSKTAYMVALRRAAHQILDSPKVFDDPIALPILGPGAEQRIRSEPRFLNRFGKLVRASMAARSRYAEDQLARSIERGTRQYVILGAGLDTFAYRNPHSQPDLRVFEVDYPATQEWKRIRLVAAGISIPSSVTFAPVNFEHQTLADGLREAGFDAAKPAFFSWLGVTMYLERETAMNTFRFIASCGKGSGVTFDYIVPRESLNWTGQLVLRAMERRVARAGEPFRTYFAPADLRAELGRMGFCTIEDLGGDELNERYFKNRTDGLRVPGVLGRFMTATT